MDHLCGLKRLTAILCVTSSLSLCLAGVATNKRKWVAILNELLITAGDLNVISDFMYTPQPLIICLFDLKAPIMIYNDLEGFEISAYFE